MFGPGKDKKQVFFITKKSHHIDQGLSGSTPERGEVVEDLVNQVTGSPGISSLAKEEPPPKAGHRLHFTFQPTTGTLF